MWDSTLFVITWSEIINEGLDCSHTVSTTPKLSVQCWTISNTLTVRAGHDDLWIVSSTVLDCIQHLDCQGLSR